MLFLAFVIGFIQSTVFFYIYVGVSVVHDVTVVGYGTILSFKLYNQVLYYI